MTQIGELVEPDVIKSMPSPHLPVRRHCLDLDDYSRHEIETVLQNTAVMKDIMRREIRKVPTLRGKSIVTLFYEPSTRTRVSFEHAGKILSADVINVSSGGSSAEKGESLYNAALTLQSMEADIIIVRHPDSGAPNFLARHLNASIINAGDGSHAHPTQALVDLYTMTSHADQIEGLRVAIIGDIQHSRVARSNLWGLTKMGANVVLCAPPTLMPVDFLGGDHSRSNNPFTSIEIETSVDRAVDGADVVMALRLQKERQDAGNLPSLREYSRLYGLTPKLLEKANPNVIVMHPGPMNEGVEIDPAVAHGPMSVIEEQVTNGVAVRMAILYSLVPATKHSLVPATKQGS